MSKSISNSYGPREELYFHKEASRGKRPLIIHVEDRPDMIFWRKIFNPYSESLDVRFVSEHSRWNEKEERKTLAKGKSSIMSLIKGGKLVLSENEIACVDADYDLLIEDTYTETINANPYIFTTKWYAIENIICHHTNLEVLYTALSEDEGCPDFKEFLETKAQKYAPLFLLHLLCRQYGLSDEYSMDALTNDIETIETEELTVREALEQHSDYTATMQCNINELETTIKAKGYEREDYYKIMQGHLLKSQIVYPFFKVQLTKDVPQSKEEEQRLEASIDDFFLFGYSLECLDVIQDIRKEVTVVLDLK